MMSVAKYNRQNSNNSQKEMERSSKPMLEKQVSFIEPLKPRVERQRSFCRSPLLRQISRNTSLMMKCVVMVSLVLNVVLIAGLAVTGTLLFKNTCPCSSPSPAPQAPDLMCYPCGEDGIPGVPVTLKSSNGYCCASRTDGKLQHLISRNILPSASAVKQQQIRQSRPCPPSDQPMKSFSPKIIAHLLVNVKETKDLNSIRWISKSSDGTAFLMGPLKITNDTIHVTKGGLYRVKSHFSLDSNSHKPNGTILFDHYVYRKRGADFTILKVEKTMLPIVHYVSSDVDLNIKLRDGDALQVFLPSYSNLYDMDIANTFDIEKID